MANPRLPTQSLTSRLSARATTLLPTSCIAFVKTALSTVVAPRSITFSHSSFYQQPTEMPFVDRLTKPESNLTTPPPEYATQQPSETPPSTSTLTVPIAASQCPSCDHDNNIHHLLHLLALQTSCLTQLLQQQQQQHSSPTLLPPQPQQQPPLEAIDTDKPGLVAYAIASLVQALFLIAFLIRPWLEVLMGQIAEWKVAERVWGGVVKATRRYSSSPPWEGPGLEAGRWWIRWMLQEVVEGVGAGVRSGLGVWGVEVG